MSDASDLYQELILDHNQRPRNFGRLDSPTHRAEGQNPLCGDTLALTLDVHDGVIRDLRFEGNGCAISRASSSLMTTVLKGKSLEEARALAAAFRALVTTEVDPDPARLGKLLALAGVRQFPMRVKCATLAWHTLLAAIDGESEPVTSE